MTHPLKPQPFDIPNLLDCRRIDALTRSELADVVPNERLCIILVRRHTNFVVGVPPHDHRVYAQSAPARVEVSDELG